MNDEAIGECDKAGRGLDPRDAITEMIDIGARRKRGIGVDAVGREQVSVTRRMDVELKEHRRLSRTFKCYFVARFDQHERQSPPCHALGLEPRAREPWGIVS